jgi:hypothetical protein
MALIIIGDVAVPLIADDAADHVVTAILDENSMMASDLMNAAAPGTKATVITNGGEVLDVVIVSSGPQPNTVMFTIGDPS